MKTRIKIGSQILEFMCNDTAMELVSLLNVAAFVEKKFEKDEKGDWNDIIVEVQPCITIEFINKE